MPYVSRDFTISARSPVPLGIFIVIVISLLLKH